MALAPTEPSPAANGAWAGRAAGQGGRRGGHGSRRGAERREENACMGFVPHGWAEEGSSFELQPGVGG